MIFPSARLALCELTLERKRITPDDTLRVHWSICSDNQSIFPVLYTLLPPFQSNIKKIHLSMHLFYIGLLVYVIRANANLFIA